jgi:NAD-dependent deacetylase
MKHLVVLTGAGMSAESGINTFRDSNGLWEQHRIEDVATPQAWENNPELVTEFYNLRRLQLNEVEPNQGHLILAQLEKHFRVSIITQNVDNLHERAGSTSIVHLHGELTKMRSSCCVDEVGQVAQSTASSCAHGNSYRPHIVWFGEGVPLLEDAAALVEEADMFLVLGTSLEVYPAAGLLYNVPQNAQRWVIDPRVPELASKLGFNAIPSGASEGMKRWCEIQNISL